MGSVASENTIERRLADHIVRHRCLWFMAVVVTVGLLGVGVSMLNVKSDYRDFVDPKDPYRQALEMMAERYSEVGDVAVVLLRPRSEDIFQPRVLAATGWVTEEIAKLAYVTRVQSVTQLLGSRRAEDTASVVSTSSAAASLRAGDLSGFLVSRTGDALAVVAYVDLAASSDRTAAARTVARDLRKLRRLAEDRYDMSVYLLGSVMFDQAMVDAVALDSKWLVPGIFALFFVLVGMAFRSAGVPAAVTACLVLTVVGAFGSAGWLGVDINVFSFSAIFVMVTIAIADSVHLVANYVITLRDREPADAMRCSLELNLRPIFLTSITTVAGLLGLCFSPSPPVRALGAVTALGVLVAMIVTVGLVPMLVMAARPRAMLSITWLNAAFSQLAAVVVRRRVLLGSVTVGLCVVATVPIYRNVLDDNSLEWFSDRLEFGRAIEFADGRIAGLRSVTYSVDCGEANGVFTRGCGDETNRFAEWLLAQPETIHVRSFRNCPDLTYGAMKSGERTSASAGGALPRTGRACDLIDPMARHSKVVVELGKVSNEELLSFEERTRGWLGRNSFPYDVQSASIPLMFARLSQENLRGMVYGGILAVFLITVVVGVGLWSWKYALVSLVPNILPMLAVYGCWGFLVAEVNIGVAAMFSTALGVVVDDTIHIMTKFRAALRSGCDTEQGIQYALKTAGPAVFFTTLCLCVGFFILGLSAFQLSAVLGVLVGSTLLAALGLDIFVLLPLLTWRRLR